MEAAEPTLDLLGAAALAISAAVWETYQLEPSDAAALNVVLAEPGISVKGLSRTLGLTHSATVRVADRLTLAGLVTRDPAGAQPEICLHMHDLPVHHLCDDMHRAYHESSE